MAELAVAKGQLCNRNSQKLLRFNVEDGYYEIWDTSNDQQVVSVTTECHRTGAESSLHVELGNNALLWHFVYVAFRLETILTGCNHA